jgi:hypothetical protein
MKDSPASPIIRTEPLPGMAIIWLALPSMPK